MLRKSLRNVWEKRKHDFATGETLQSKEVIR